MEPNPPHVIADNAPLFWMIAPDWQPSIDRIRRDTPEWRLWCAVLDDGLSCYLRQASVSLISDTERKAYEWVESESGHVGSFRYVCSVLGLEPDAVRAMARSKRGSWRPTAAEVEP